MVLKASRLEVVRGFNQQEATMNEIDPRVSILVEVKDEPGSLYNLLAFVLEV